LKKQIEIGATKIFAFDKPPIYKLNESNSQFRVMDYDTTKEIIKNNIDVALLQSNYLQINNINKVKDFYYIMHGNSKELLDYNIQLLEQNIGMNNFKKYFGGVCYGSKDTDKILFTTVLLHANEYFTKNNIPVHILGAGSPIKILLMVRTKMNTFDSATAISGLIRWDYFNRFNPFKKIKLTQKNFKVTDGVCACKSCININFKQSLDEKKFSDIGAAFTLHNLILIIEFIEFLKSIEINQYTETIVEAFNIGKKTLNCLEYIDYSEKNGFERAYERYKYYINNDETKQKSLFR